MQCGVCRPVLEQGQVAKKDVDLGMIRGLSNSRLQGGTNQRDLIAHECQLGEQGVGRRQLRVRLDGLGELLEAGVEISLLEALNRLVDFHDALGEFVNLGGEGW